METKSNASAAEARIIGLYAHIDAGKTTTSEGILYHTGRIHRPGRVDEGNTQLDWMVQERERGITITSAAATCAWNGCRINLIDTPGHVDFSAEVVRSMRVIDGAVVALCGVGGVEAQTGTVWLHADRERLPRLIYVNKLDRRGADFARVLAEVRAGLAPDIAVLQLPIGGEKDFTGVVDLIERRALYWRDGADRPAVEPVAPALEAAVEAARGELLEAICGRDDELLERWLDGDEPEPALLRAALRRATVAGELVPVLCGSSLRGIGLQPLLDAVVAYLPAPGERGGATAGPSAPLCATVFKLVNDPYVGHLTWVRVLAGGLRAGGEVYNPRTGRRERIGRIFRMHADQREILPQMAAGDIVALGGAKQVIAGDTLCDPDHVVEQRGFSFPDPVLTVALAAADDEAERLARAVARLCAEDPTLVAGVAEQTGELTLAGLGELHLEVAVDRLRTEFAVAARMGAPQIAYRETARRRAEEVGTYKRQSGGHGHYAQVRLRLEPLPRGRGVEFANKAETPGGLEDRGRGHRRGVPAEYVRHVEQGVREVLAQGVYAGYPFTDARVTLVAGRFHSVDTCGMDFRIAGSMATRQVARQSRPALIEPVMRIDIDVAEERFGAVAADLARRRGRVCAVEARVRGRRLTAEAPLSGLRGYASDLRSLTQGHCALVMDFDHYDYAPEEQAVEIAARRRGEGLVPER